MTEEDGVSKSISKWLKEIREKHRDSSKTTDSTVLEDDVFRHPREVAVANKAIERLVRDRQRKKARKVGSPNPHLLPVELKIDNPYNLLSSTEGLLYELKPYILDELEDRNIFEVKNPAAEDDDRENFTYIIDENAGEETPGVVIGGASTIIYNMAEELNWNEDERDLVKYAHQVAAESNGFERHTLVGEVLIIPVHVDKPDKEYLS